MGFGYVREWRLLEGVEIAKGYILQVITRRGWRLQMVKTVIQRTSRIASRFSPTP
jgi:hypothetical protein